MITSVLRLFANLLQVCSQCKDGRFSPLQRCAAEMSGTYTILRKGMLHFFSSDGSPKQQEPHWLPLIKTSCKLRSQNQVALSLSAGPNEQSQYSKELSGMFLSSEGLVKNCVATSSFDLSIFVVSTRTREGHGRKFPRGVYLEKTVCLLGC